MIKYDVGFAIEDEDEVEGFEVEQDPGVFADWNERIEQEKTISFYDTDGTLIVLNGRFVVGYVAIEVKE